MSSWKPDLPADGSPRYQAIARAMRDDLRAGRLSPGQRLPPQRALAAALGLDLTTVTRAFNLAREMGLTEARAGRGSFIRAAAAEAVEPPVPPVIDLSMNMPPQPEAARLRARIQEGLAGLLAESGGLMALHYQDSLGAAPDRAAAARWLAPRLGTVPPARLVVAAGAQAALSAIMRVLLPPGTALGVPALTYPGLRAAAARQGVRLVPLAMDADGLVPAALEEACGREALRALYCVPTLDNPTTATLPPARREAIVALARRFGLSLIEDDAYGALARAAPPPLAALAPDIAWHVATLSKCLTPALRTAYVAAPGPAAAQRLGAELRAATLMAPPLMAALATRWVQEGVAGEITAAIRAESVARQALAARVLRGWAMRAQPEGHHLWLHLPEGWRQAELVAEARQSGLALVPSSAFGEGSRGLRIALGAAPGREALERGLLALAALLGRGTGGMGTFV